MSERYYQNIRHTKELKTAEEVNAHFEHKDAHWELLKIDTIDRIESDKLVRGLVYIMGLAELQNTSKPKQEVTEPSSKDPSNGLPPTFYDLNPNIWTATNAGIMNWLTAKSLDVKKISYKMMKEQNKLAIYTNVEDVKEEVLKWVGWANSRCVNGQHTPPEEE